MDNTTFGNDGLWIFALLILLFGGGGFGFGNNRATDQAIANNEILSGQKFDMLSRQINQVGDGIASLGYSQLQQMDNNTASINGNVTAEGRGLQTQLADCCCTTQRNIDSVRFDMANYHADTNAVITAQTQKVLDAIAQNKIDSLTAQVNQLQINQALCGVPKISTYAWGTYPYNNGCGCACNNAI